MSTDFLRSLRIAAGGMRAQAGRMRVVAENIANANSTAETAGGDPYRRKVPTFRTSFDRELQATTVQLGPVRQTQGDFQTRYDPNHPAADARGFVKIPNVNSLVEAMDMREAQRSYEANLNVVTSTRRMLQRTIDLLKA
ncbi:flagellar basal body rod protein FlgC [Phreatobacter sp. AB_2022a]|uniref:flagellar basal body rod protein FlgC n=1 Tax=Phreatobacter sp. AB_2022a TaxID=3003134 RepID=UPI002286EDC7|nr:flagellar basal body rod protein FlgC [Phreatobacter sp. AB_2022a]MCZ0737909.1 flagellar basal body rod protein FlgC [Phreatobacter sp. AB_2022a]